MAKKAATKQGWKAIFEKTDGNKARGIFVDETREGATEQASELARKYGWLLVGVHELENQTNNE